MSKFKGVIIAGNQAQYRHYLETMGLKWQEYKLVTTFDSIRGFHEIPAVTIGTCLELPEWTEIYEYALHHKMLERISL